jgi:prophage regulatory protein
VNVISEREVCSRTGLSRSTILRYEHAGTFPQRIQLGAMRIGWIESEVTDWITSRTRGPISFADLNVTAA